MAKCLTDPERLALLHNYLNGSMSQYAFQKAHRLCPGTIRYWLRKFALQDKPTPMNQASKLQSAPADTERELQELRMRLAQLELENQQLKKEAKHIERKLKHEALGHEAYKMLVELAEETYGIEILKNSDAK